MQSRLNTLIALSYCSEECKDVAIMWCTTKRARDVPGGRARQWSSVQSLAVRAHCCRESAAGWFDRTPPCARYPSQLRASGGRCVRGIWLWAAETRAASVSTLPGRLELPTLRLTASRSSQLS